MPSKCLPSIMKPMLSPEECAALAAAYESDKRFRSRIVMECQNFGRGEHKYFSYPLPKRINYLRTDLYPHLVNIANR